MMRNPELLRNIWLELTPHRLIVTPLVMLGLFFIVYKLSDNSSMGLFDVGFYLFIFFTYVWGTRCASTSLCDEVNSRTWDWQRMSQLSPNSLGLGKLLGSTSFTWFAGAIAFLVMLWFGQQAKVESLGAKSLLLLIGALFTQALALLFSVQGLNFGTKRKLRSFKYFLIALLVGAYVTLVTYHALFSTGYFYTTYIKWHGWVFGKDNFALVSFMILLGWAILGLNRCFRIELQYRSVPWAWALFNLYSVVYFSGFINFEQNLPDIGSLKEAQKALENNGVYAAFMLATTLTYFSFLSENINRVRYKKWFAALNKPFGRMAFESMPRWPISMVFAAVAGLWLAFTPPVQDFKPAVFALSLLLLLVRDLFIAHYFYLGKSSKRVGMTIAFYLAVLYLLIPVILYLISLPMVAALFIPGVGKYPVASIVGPCAQAVVAGWLVWRRWGEE